MIRFTVPRALTMATAAPPSFPTRGDRCAPFTNLCNPPGPKAPLPPRGEGMGAGGHFATPAAKLCCEKTNGSAA